MIKALLFAYLRAHRQAHARDAGEEDRVEGLRKRQVVGGAERPVAQIVEVEARRPAADPSAGSREGYNSVSRF